MTSKKRGAPTKKKSKKVVIQTFMIYPYQVDKLSNTGNKSFTIRKLIDQWIRDGCPGVKDEK